MTIYSDTPLCSSYSKFLFKTARYYFKILYIFIGLLKTLQVTNDVHFFSSKGFITLRVYIIPIVIY